MVQRLAQAAKIGIGLWMAGVAIATFLVVPQYEGLGDAGRIVIVHVPTAWVSVVAFTISAIFSGLYLWRRRERDDHIAVAAAEAGLLFTLLATITGMIFSQVAWGIFWNWDPRQTSIFVLLLIYAALFALRAAIDDIDRRRQLSAVYSLFAFVTMPFLFFIAPRIADSTLHPNCAFIQGSNCDGVVLEVGKVGLIGDQKVQLLGLERKGNLLVAEVKVSTPGLQQEAILYPSLDLVDGGMADRPEFPGSRFRLGLEEYYDEATGAVRLNMEAPGTNLLENRRTLYVFLAANLGFTALFFWMLQVRSLVLDLQWAIAQRGRVMYG
jgi:heme exporter protein C